MPSHKSEDYKITAVKYIFRKYKDHLIVMDNAGGHRNKYVWDANTESGNQYLHSVPYTLITNPI